MAEDQQAGRVFISYRRQETAWPARQLYELLVAEFGADRIFKDVDNIEPGDDFVQRLQSAVASCDVLLALIGPQWLTISNAQGRRRLDDPSDFVRLELETGLTRDDVRVIPILVDDAAMPAVGELPAGLRALTRRQAIEISPTTFDTRRLLKVLHDTLNRTPEAAPSSHEVAAADTPAVAAPANPPATPLVTATATAPTAAPAADGTPPTVIPPPGGRTIGRGSWTGRRVVGAVVAALVLATAVVLLVTHLPSTGAGSAALGPTSGASGQTSAASSGPSGPASSTSTPPAGDSGSDVLAHRGGDEKFPLETQESITNAADAGFAVETDVRWTSDGTAVVVHDEAASKGVRCDRPIQVSKTTWKQLDEHCHSQVLNGKYYPLTTYASLMDALAAYRSWVYVEVKVDQNDKQNREFVSRITGNGLSDRTVVTSTDPRRLSEIAALAPDLRRLQFVSSRVPVSELKQSRLWGVAVRIDVATKDYVSELKRAGLVVVVWTPNEPQSWSQARALGADKVLTDKPRAYTSWLSSQ